MQIYKYTAKKKHTRLQLLVSPSFAFALHLPFLFPPPDRVKPALISGFVQPPDSRVQSAKARFGEPKETLKSTYLCSIYSAGNKCRRKWHCLRVLAGLVYCMYISMS